MRSIKMVVAASILVVMCLAIGWSSAYANDRFERETELARKLMQTERELIILKNMDLTSSESQLFWPLYREYHSDVSKIYDRLIELVIDYSGSYEDISDEKAKEILDRFLSIEKDKIDLKMQYVEKFSKLLPYKKVARFFQLENKLDTKAKFNLASQIPLMGGKEVK